jgi:hypothetical protein
MKYYLTFTISLLLHISATKSVYAQESNDQQPPVSFFLDCEDCDFTFVRQEMPFVSFVRDPQLADVHILVTDSNTGSGGNKYFFNFIGQGEFDGLNFDYSATTNQSDTDDDIRKNLLKIIKIGILPYYSKKGYLDQLTIDLAQSEKRTVDDMIIDPWNKWIFRLGAAGDFQKERSQNEFSYDLDASVGKITEEWKTNFRVSYEINREKYYDNGSEIINKQDTRVLQVNFIKSLNDKWSAGLFGDYLSRTFINVKSQYLAKAGIEYNIFPWKECNRRVFVIRYSVGISTVDYIEKTIYDKLNETHTSESLELNLELIQPWGEISVGLEGNHYFYDFSKNRLTFESDISVRLTKNLSVYTEIRSEAIHDQLYLPAGDASLEDILLRRRKLATEFEISGDLGFRFTFGSIYNNVVNERF